MKPANAPLSRDEIKPCAICSKGLMHNGMPLVWRITATRIGIDRTAVQRQHGMEQFFQGHVGIANVFDGNADYGKPVSVSQFMLCEDCVLNRCGAFSVPALEGETHD